MPTNERGCGTRVRGALYLASPPVLTEVLDLVMATLDPMIPPAAAWPYWVDPPVQIDMRALRLPDVGVHWFQRDGVWHLIDWVGIGHYPCVADFVAEALAMGVSRRIAWRTDFTRLTEESRYLLVHRRGYLADWERFMATPAERRAWYCPAPMAMALDHRDGVSGPCATHFWWDGPMDDRADVNSGRGNMTRRRLPNGMWYYIHVNLHSDFDAQPGIFASLPIYSAMRLEAIGPSTDVGTPNANTLARRLIDLRITDDLDVRVVEQ
jgi:hypothetical protein